jgi:uncharacterized protein
MRWLRADAFSAGRLRRKSCPIILDDGRARRVAKGLGLHVVGIVGILMAAKRRRLVRSVRPHLDRLLASGFRLSPEWYERALSQAGETTRP